LEVARTVVAAPSRVVKCLWEVFVGVWGAVRVVCVSVSGVLFSVVVCVCVCVTLLIFLQEVMGALASVVLFTPLLFTPLLFTGGDGRACGTRSVALFTPLLFTETKKQSPKTGARANNTPHK